MAKLLKNPTLATSGNVNADIINAVTAINADIINAVTAINVVGNVSASYLLGNGYYLNGVAGSSNYSNVNAAAYLLTNTGNVKASYFVGNGYYLTGISTTSSTYSNSSVASYLPTYSGSINAGNVNVGNLIAGTYGVYAANYYYANGRILSSGSSSGGATALTGLSDVNISGPSNGQVLKYNGSQWVNGTDNTTTGGSGTLATRSSAAVTISGLGAGANANVAITGFKTYSLMAIQTSAAAWVTVYSNTFNRTADITRSITTDPTPGSGVLAEVITTGNQKVWFSPALIGYSAESSPTNDIPIKVNNTGSSGDIIVTMTLLQLEN